MLRHYWKKILAWLGQNETKTPVILQMDATECGAAALGSVLAFYGCETSLEALRIHCEVSRHGCRADLMLKAARYYGMEAEAATAEPEDLYEVKLPVIAHWKFEHFIVIERLTPTGIDVNDPAVGRLHISWQAFEEDFTGVILMLTPGPAFKSSKKRFSFFKSIMTRIKEGKQVLLFIFLLSLALIIPGIIIPTFSMIFINQILIEHMHGWLVPLLFGLLVTGLFRAGFSLLQQFIILKMRMALVISSSIAFIQHLLILPIDFFQKRFSGDIIERISANDRVASLLSNELVTNSVGLISMVFFAIVMFFYSWQLTLIVIVITAVNALVFYKQSLNLAEISRSYLQQRGRLQGLEMNHVSMIEDIKAGALEDYSFIRWSSLFIKLLNNAHKLAQIDLKLKLTSYLSVGITNLLLISIGALFVVDGKLTIGALVALQSLAMSFQAPVDSLLALGDNIQKIKGDFQRLDDILNQPIEHTLTVKKVDSPHLSGGIALNHLSFGYSKQEPAIINDISITIQPNEHIAIVGPTGGGKSTLVKLLAGFEQPWQGSVLYDNYVLPELDEDTFSQFFSLVSQDIAFFSGTIRDNLSLGDRRISDETMIEALHDASLYDELNDKNLGFCLNINLQENGTNLSAGQRQRLEIARSLVRSPKVLVLDEATSNLDTLTEDIILANLKKRKMTLIIISHRLSIIRDCHCIYLIKDGHVVDFGKHDDLIEKNIFYKELVYLENDTYAI